MKRSVKKKEPQAVGAVRHDVQVVGDQDLHFFNEGTHFRLHTRLGAQRATAPDGETGVAFAVWAPNAERVCVMGDFNGWSHDRHDLRERGHSGIWEGFVAGLERGSLYKYRIRSRLGGYEVDKADPFAVRQQTPPDTGSVVWDLDYEWHDQEWMKSRQARTSLSSPVSIYEVHLGSWMRMPEEGDRFLSYRELAPRLADYVESMAFTHVELMPLAEHPFYGSWGYQVTGYFAPTARLGTPQDLMYLIDHLHQRGIGVIMDWVPSHFPTDEHGLAYFDGTHLYEHADPRKGLHKDWDSYIFNYGRHEVRSFLMSSAFCWLEAYHMDALRVDAVASMLYLDYSRAEGEWVPNEHGGRENLEAVSFLRRFNEDVFREHPDVQTVAEESTSWPMVSRPLYLGGLGFGFKWDMGWMHDTLQYFARDPVFRRFHHNLITFRMMYAWSENFVLALSHDEVVHGKGSLLGKMTGDEWQQRANLRLLFAYMYGLPGKKLLFMGGEFGQRREWNHDQSLDWHLLEDPRHAGLQRCVRELNAFYRGEPAMHERDHEPAGFRWIDCNDADKSIVSFVRTGRDPDHPVLVLCNFTPVPRQNYRVGTPRGGFWEERINTDADVYGGAGWGNMGGAEASPTSAHGQPFSLTVTLPPLAALMFRCVGPRS